MSTISIFLFLLGLALLLGGAELLVRGASSLAGAAGISPLVVGLTVVAFGTSSPELAVSVMAAARGQAELALGNVVGSNIFNVLFILGASALAAPLVVAQQVVRRDVPLVVCASAVVWWMASDAVLGRLEASLLMAGVVAYTAWSIHASRRETAAVRLEYQREFGTAAGGASVPDGGGDVAGGGAERSDVGGDTTDAGARARPAADRREGGGGAPGTVGGDAPEDDRPDDDAVPPADGASPWAQAGWVVLGLALLVLGSRWLVDGAVALAGAVGVSDAVIGLTVVAAGTSLPEAATSLVAAVRGQRDIAVGNVVGSNLFNLLAILGVAGLVAPGGVAVPAPMLAFDLPVMTAVAVACLPIFFTGYRIARWEGAFFLLCYLAYLAYLVLAAGAHPSLAAYRRAMLGFALPLTAVTLGVLAWRAWRRGRGGGVVGGGAGDGDG